MNNIQELKQKRAAVLHQMKEVNAAVLAEKRSMTTEEETKWDKMEADVVQYDTEIRNLERDKDIQERAASAAFKSGDAAPAGTDSATVDYRSAFDSYLRKGESGLSVEERAAIEQRAATDPQTVSVSADGGLTVPSTVADTVIRVMKDYGSVMNEARIITTSGGGSYSHPVNDDTSNKGAILGEAVADAVNKATFTDVTFGAYKYTSKGIEISRELLQDSAVNMEQLIAEIMAERIGRITNEHFTTGTNTGQPQGVVTGSLLGKAATSATAITRGEIVDLTTSVDVAYRGTAASKRAKFMMNDLTMGAIRKLSIGSADDRPLYQASAIAGEADRIEGYEVVINNDMPSIATGLKPILFGDYQQFAIRQVLNPVILRSSERNIERDVISFYMFARYDSKILVPSAIKHLVMA